VSVAVRLLTERATDEITALVSRNLVFLAPWEPLRSDDYATEPIQRRMITDALTRHADGASVPLVITLDDVIVGRINVADIVRGAFQSAHLGYWVSQDSNGRGVAGAAVAAAVALSFGEYGLHRLQAGTLVHNHRSQQVLERNGFTRIGLAPRYLRIAGEWQDHLLFQRLAD
jgi:ribosomal-protein-alanine N-acetyltransferase